MAQLIHTLDPKLLAEDVQDTRYANSPFRALKTLGPKVRGARYEKITIALMKALGHDYGKRTSTDSDARFDGVEFEIKGSMLGKNSDQFSFLQIRPNQNYDSLMFTMLYPDRVVIMTMTKDQVKHNVEQNVFKKQHEGKTGLGATYCYYGNQQTLSEIGATLLHEIT